MKFGVLRGKDECLPLGYGSTTTELFLLLAGKSLKLSLSLPRLSRCLCSESESPIRLFFSLVLPLIRLCCSVAWARLLVLALIWFCCSVAWAGLLGFGLFLLGFASVVYIVVGSDINYNHINKIINIILFVDWF